MTTKENKFSVGQRVNVKVIGNLREGIITEIISAEGYAGKYYIVEIDKNTYATMPENNLIEKQINKEN
jgi:hypothetical protein